MTKEELFIAKASKKHGGKYDYSKVVYVNASTKVCIICPVHGEFWQTPNAHLIGQGCPKCGTKKRSEEHRSNTNEFVVKANKIYNNRYNYSKVNYIDAKTKVCIICPEHGEFWKTPNAHLRGGGCPICGIKKRTREHTCTKEEFIKQAIKIHGNRYDYSKVEYVNNRTDVCIICPEHGEFWQRPTVHLRGNGCKKCGVEKTHTQQRKTTEQFIEEARKVHGNKYDYSKVEYKSGKSKVCIICPEHGEFWQLPIGHLRGKGCPRCARPNSNLTLSEFIAKSNEVHKNKYDYSKVDYKDTCTKVRIVCPIHGVFLQTPSKHLSGQGCPKCGGRYPCNTEEFIKRSQKIHGDKYEYSKVNYINTSTKVCIICPEHGEFWQTPDGHLHGAGCPICSGSYKSNIEEFIKKAREVHGDRYDYSKTEYETNSTKVCIICRKHGEFWQTPANHLKGKGCQKCKITRTELDVMKYLDENKIRYTYQHTFDWLKNIGSLFYDFYIPEYNVAIECQGIQHFKEVGYFGGEKALVYNIEKDKLKKKLSEEHGIKVFYYSNLGIDYPYHVYEDIEQLINDIKQHSMD